MGLCINFQFKISKCPFCFQVASSFIFCCNNIIHVMDNPVQLGPSSPMHTTSVLENASVSTQQAAVSAGSVSEHCRTLHISSSPQGPRALLTSTPSACWATNPAGEVKPAASAPWEADCHRLIQDLPTDNLRLVCFRSQS